MSTNSLRVDAVTRHIDTLYKVFDTLNICKL